MSIHNMAFVIHLFGLVS